MRARERVIIIIIVAMAGFLIEEINVCSFV